MSYLKDLQINGHSCLRTVNLDGKHLCGSTIGPKDFGRLKEINWRIAQGLFDQGLRVVLDSGTQYVVSALGECLVRGERLVAYRGNGAIPELTDSADERTVGEFREALEEKDLDFFGRPNPIFQEIVPEIREVHSSIEILNALDLPPTQLDEEGVEIINPPLSNLMSGNVVNIEGDGSYAMDTCPDIRFEFKQGGSGYRIMFSILSYFIDRVLNHRDEKKIIIVEDWYYNLHPIIRKPFMELITKSINPEVSDQVIFIGCD